MKSKQSFFKIVCNIAIPITLQSMLQSSFSIVDQLMIGQLGSVSIAGIGLAGKFVSIYSVLLGSIAAVAGIMIAQYIGQKDEKEVHQSFYVNLMIALANAVVFTVLCLCFSTSIIQLYTADSATAQTGAGYLQILSATFVPMVGASLLSTLLRCREKAAYPLYAGIVAAIINTGLNYILIFGRFGFPAMGVTGAALATVISQSLSFILCFVYMWVRYPLMRLQKHHFAVSGKLLGEMFRIGCSMGFMISFINIGSVALQMAINTFGDSIIVAHTAARKISDFFMMPFIVFGVAMATFCGQNLGAGKIDRIKKGLRQIILLNWCWCGLVLLMAYTIAPFFIQAVTGTSDTVTIETGALYLRVNTILYFVCAVIIILRNAMQGIGDSITPIISSFLELATKVLVAVLLAPKLGYWAIIISEPISWVIMVIPLLVQIRRNPLLREGKSEP